MSTIEKALQKQSQAKKANDKPVDSENAPVEALVAPSTEVTQPTNANKASSERLLSIDLANLESRGYLVDTGTRKNIKDEFRLIKRKILNNAFGKAAKTLRNSNLIMVSSAKPNEGKTFVAINLAMSIALEQDKTVLLIDADVLRPSVNRELDIGEQPGLIEFLLGDVAEIGDVIYNTNVEKLKLIPAGKPHHLSNELLASDKMIGLSQELATRYPDRVVIFDCPPLLGVNETLVLSSLVGQGIIVIEESKTSINNINKATENLSEELALGVVVNKAIKSNSDLYGYYGYGISEKS